MKIYNTSRTTEGFQLLNIKNIIVIEDDESIRLSMLYVLRGEGFSVQAYCNGREALDLMDLSEPTLIFLDLSMPVMDGETFVRRAKLDMPDQFDNALIYLFSGSKEALERVSKAVPVKGCLSKPYAVSDVLKILNTIRSCRGDV